MTSLRLAYTHTINPRTRLAGGTVWGVVDGEAELLCIMWIQGSLDNGRHNVEGFPRACQIAWHFLHCVLRQSHNRRSVVTFPKLVGGINDGREREARGAGAVMMPLGQLCAQVGMEGQSKLSLARVLSSELRCVGACVPIEGHAPGIPTKRAVCLALFPATVVCNGPLPPPHTLLLPADGGEVHSNFAFVHAHD
ncbi:hypothetical protein LX36DRAFT_151236 [Colletotrichum falcatum]|nr:hypothetical protein LX36DRAFT_151236 [Colletotrichum falcatum]